MSTYYVRSSGGSDGNTGLSFAQGWATIQYALNTATTYGDIILVCNDGIHYPTASLTFPTGTASVEVPMIMRGASATGNDDGTVATISGASLPASTDLFYVNYYISFIFSNLRITAGKQDNFHIAVTAGGYHIHFRNCRFDNAARYGINSLENDNGKGMQIIECEIDNNGQSGIINDCSVYGGHFHLVNCKIHDNVQHGYIYESFRYSDMILGCLFYNNLYDGIYVNTGCYGAHFANNIFFNNRNGINYNMTGGSLVQAMLYNNIFRFNSQYGVASAGELTSFSFFDYNCFSNNTSGDFNQNGGIPLGSHNILSDPLFTSESPGAEDFTLQSGSPCKNIGFGYNG